MSPELYAYILMTATRGEHHSLKFLA